MTTIFYSWLKGLPNSTNRGFIEEALKKAIKDLNKNPAFVDAPREMDSDTAGVPGSPAIADTIFEKIRNADICVFDVSLAIRGPERRCPNPNVLIELGYAVHALAWDRIVMVFNRAFGEPEELPFDIRGRRIVDYHAAEGAEGLAEERKRLVGKLKGRLDESYQFLNKHRFSEDEKKFFAKVYSGVRSFLDVAHEYPDRCLGIWRDLVGQLWRKHAEMLRDACLADAAMKNPDLAAGAKALAGHVDGLVNFHHSLISHQEFMRQIRAASDAATPLLALCHEPLRGELQKEDFRRQKRELARRALDGLQRLKDGLAQHDSPTIKSARDAMSKAGAELLALVAKLEIVEDADAPSLRRPAYALHVAEVEKSRENGYREETELLARLAPLVESLKPFAQNA